MGNPSDNLVLFLAKENILPAGVSGAGAGAATGAPLSTLSAPLLDLH